MAILGRSWPIQAHRAKPIVSLLPPQPPTKILAGWKLARNDIGVDRPPKPPKPHVVSGVVVSLLRPQPSAKILAGWKLARNDNGFDRPPRPPNPHIASAVAGSSPLAGFIAPSPKIKLQAGRRALVRRSASKPHLASAVVNQQVVAFIAPSLVFINQGKTRPKAFSRVDNIHVSGALVSLSQPVAPAVVVTQDLRRVFLGRRVPKPHISLPNLASQPLPPVLIKSQVLARPPIGRRSARPVVTPQLGAPQPVLHGVFNYQALNRIRIGRKTFSPHLVGSLVASPSNPFTAPSPKVKLQAGKRSLLGRLIPKAHVAGPNLTTAVAQFIAPDSILVSQQSKQRPFIGRRAPRPTLLEPASNNPFIAGGGFIKFQSGRRMIVGRKTIRPHLSSAVTDIKRPFAPVFIKSQALARPPIGRRSQKPFVLPSLGVQPPVLKGTFVSQFIRRTSIGRRGSRPIILPVLGSRQPVRPGLFITGQSQRRSGLVRRGQRPTVLPILGSNKPFAPAVVVTQSLRRTLVGRWWPKPHVTASISVPVPVFIAPSPKVRLQSGRSMLIGRKTPRPHVATASLQASARFVPFVISQAVRRPVTGWRKKPFIARPLLASLQPVAKGTFIHTPYVSTKRVIHPHVAAPVTATVFIAHSPFITKAKTRPNIKLITVHVAPSIKPTLFIAPLGLIKSVRNFVRRKGALKVAPGFIPPVVLPSATIVRFKRNLVRPIYWRYGSINFAERYPVTVGHQSVNPVVQPALTGQQGSLKSTVQPALVGQRQSMQLTTQPALQ